MGIGVAWMLGSIAPLTMLSNPAEAAFNHPTYSSPITLSADDKLLWSVNPGNDSVSVIRTDTNAIIKKIKVGNEPQSVAVTPDNKFAFVANAASSNVTIIRITNASPGAFSHSIAATKLTGAEPWNIVVSPDGKRVFVANSGQDTITVLDARPAQIGKIIGHIKLRNSLCNNPDHDRHFQPRGLAVTVDSNRLFVSSFLAFTKTGGRQGDDNGKQGLVCRININTASTNIADYKPLEAIRLASRITGFKIDKNNDTVPDNTSAFPNQLQSIVIRGNKAYLPNIAASPTGPLKFNVDTQAFVNIITGVNNADQQDWKAINLHLGARDPEPGKKKLFFANPWAIAFTNQSGAGNAYVVSAGSDLLVKVRVAADGTLSNTVDADTTRYIDLNDPDDPDTSGFNACKNPLGIILNNAGNRAYVTCRVSGTVSVVNLGTQAVVDSIRTTTLPPPGGLEEKITVGAEMFFSSRGHFNRPAGTTVSTDERLSSEGWQNCASCHFEGLTDGVVWQFGTGPRKSVPLNGSFNPKAPLNDQRILNYTAIFDEVEDFELNIRNVSGPGPLATAVTCQKPETGGPTTSTFDPNHGLLIGDNGNINRPPCTVVAFNKPNANRKQLTVTLPGSSTKVPALTALKQWVQFAIRSPNGPLETNQLSSGVSQADVKAGRTLFDQAGCANCHSGGKWTTSTKNFKSPPAAARISTETDPNPANVAPNPNGAQYLFRFLEDVGSFNLSVKGQGNPIPGQPVIGAVELDQVNKDALGRDHDNDGKGEGFNIPSLLGIFAVPPYFHNGACESLTCVIADKGHRTANGALQDVLNTANKRRLVVRFLESIDESNRVFQ
jgi:YVTN family beta-propeller protein